jgi:predicted aspartyl protease
MTKLVRLRNRVTLMSGCLTVLLASTFVWGTAQADAVTSPPVGPSAAQACQLNVLARLPLSEWNQHFVAPVTINGREVNLVVDTGAQVTSVTPELDAALELPADRLQRYHTVSVGGTGPTEFKRIVWSLGIGRLEWLRVDVAVDEILTDRQRGDPASAGGLLGADLMSGYDVELDFPGGTMTFYRIAGCQGSFAPWQGRYVAFSFGYSSVHHAFVIPVTINGHTVRAKLDSGSMTTVITRAAALDAAVDTAALDSDRLVSGLQSAASTYDAHLHRFDTIDIGDTRFRNAAIEVVDRSLPDVDMLIGLDFLKSRRVWLSYGTGQVFIQRVAALPTRQGAQPGQPAFHVPGGSSQHDSP